MYKSWETASCIHWSTTAASKKMKLIKKWIEKLKQKNKNIKCVNCVIVCCNSILLCYLHRNLLNIIGGCQYFSTPIFINVLDSEHVNLLSSLIEMKRFPFFMPDTISVCPFSLVDLGRKRNAETILIALLSSTSDPTTFISLSFLHKGARRFWWEKRCNSILFYCVWKNVHL